MELRRNTSLAADISTEFEAISYQYTGSNLIEIMGRADVGSSVRPIAGDGDYQLKVLLNDVHVSPENPVAVATGVTRTILMSRPLALEPGDVVKVLVLGQPADVSVDLIISLRDVTPTKTADILGGGPVAVDHNYGSTDSMTYETAAGLGIPGANIQVFLTSDFNAGNRSAAFVVAQTTTDAHGHWARSLSLFPGDYTVLASAPGRYGPNRRDITVV